MLRHTARQGAVVGEEVKELGMLIGRMTLAMAGTVAVAGMTLSSAPVFAQGSLQDQMAVCARIGKKSARIECYDSIASAPQGSFAPSSSGFGAENVRTPAAPPMQPPAPPAAASTGFGAETVRSTAPQRSANAGADEVQVAVASSRDNGLNMWQFNLADGAVWRMTERASASFRPPAPNETVTIRKAALGSYLMDVGRQSSVRVERVR